MEYKLDDLLPLCKKCGGMGQVDEYATQQRQGNSYGAKMDYYKFGPCEECQGFGAVPTPQGKILIEFVQRAKEKGFLR
jgi:RecJ-like exonuclease